MPNTISLPLFDKMLTGGLEYGAVYAVEFEPHSLWYESSLTIAAQAVRQNVLTDYHTFQHIPSDIRRNLAIMGLDVKKLEETETLRVMDSYNVTTGFAPTEQPELYLTRSLKLKDWDAGVIGEMTGKEAAYSRRRLHVDDNTSVLVEYNGEKAFLEHWRTKALPETRALELAVLNTVVKGVYSESFYKQFESICDGIIDVVSEDEGGQMSNFMRVRMIHGRTLDTRWRKLHLQENGEVQVDAVAPASKELGIKRWVKGSKS